MGRKEEVVMPSGLLPWGWRHGGGCGGDLPDCSSEVHPLEITMHGPMEEMRSEDFEHRQVRSEAEQPMSAAAELRQPRAHSGSWLTRLSRSVVELAAAVVVAVVL